MDGLPIYKLTISEDDNDDSGVIAVALVDAPAIEQNWMAFSKQHKFKTSDEEKRIISGPLMIAGQPIYRNDQARGEYYVVFEKDTIYQIVQKFFRKGSTRNVNMMHEESLQANGVYMIESMLIDSERGITTPKGFDKLPDGSWFGSFKVDNDQIWQDFIKTGVFKGFSVEGFFKETKTDELTEGEIKQLQRAIG